MPQAPEVITVTDLRKRLDDILYTILLQKKEYVITKHGKPYARLGPVKE